MARVNPQVEALERENKLLREYERKLRMDPSGFPLTGCGDNSCLVAKPNGMATNGGCRCPEREVRLALQFYKRYTHHLLITIDDIKTEIARLKYKADSHE